MPAPLEALPDDPAVLKAMIVAERAEADRMVASMRAYEALIQALKIHIARLKKQKFGPSSEKIARDRAAAARARGPRGGEDGAGGTGRGGRRGRDA